MGKNIEKRGLNQLWEGKQSQKGQSQKKVKESSQGMGEVETSVKLCKKWMTHEHESENHTVVAC